MGLFFLVLGIVVLLIAAMSIGVILGRKPITGTCGGLNALGDGKPCEICGGNPQKCDEENGREPGTGSKAENLAYDASEDRR